MTAKEAALAVSGTVSGSAEINGVVIDSRKVKKGCLFVAIHGENFDGHDFIHSAFKAGAAAVMSHKDIDIDSDIPIIRVKDTAKALLDLAKFYRGKFDIPIVSLTGSVGKTTTKEMLHKVMSKKYKTLKTQGNLNNEIGLPMTLFGLDDTFEAAVVEMGMNHAGEISRLSTAACATAAIITNIGVSHIGNLGSRENILK
ncbi:MAG: UDP-N-acetylmuramoyl-tripeptide--D-alanyl-D-alanine ligase, partial [Oscillospiraceae bacterium]|nr:UDP-N-acetylmuramoyl-tripeptide--D-alanyl-D-alanine ligase [Oscillospiraceae bacterium]